jgi:DNA repair protein RadC
VLATEGPRERQQRLGPEALTDEELVGLVLTGGASGKRLAEVLLRRIGGLAMLRGAELESLREWGIGPSRASALCAALELARRLNLAEAPTRPSLRSASEAYAFLRPRLAYRPVEVFSVTLMDVRLRVLREVQVAEGNGWSCAVHPRDALLPALRDGAAAVLFAHNHPSGDSVPSDDDRALTRRLVSACELLGIRPVDHLVVCLDGFSSMRELGEWPQS